MSVAPLEQDQRQSLLKLTMILNVFVLLIIAFSLCKTIASPWKCKEKKNTFTKIAFT